MSSPPRETVTISAAPSSPAAGRAEELFTGSAIPAETVEAVLAGLTAQLENVVLIGMPGCGKSTVGRALARRQGKASRVTTPPPVLMTQPVRAPASRTAQLSRVRKASSPSWAKMAGMDFPARSSMRRGEDNYETLSRHADAQVLLNTTPVGMYPNCGVSPVSLDAFPHLEGVLDVVYNPLRTALLLEARERGLPCSCGLPMLVAQAWRAEELFTGSAIPAETVEAVLAGLRVS